MTVQLNHTLVSTHDREASARFLAEMLGLGDPYPYGPFVCVDLDNGASLDFMEVDDDPVHAQHYAFLVGDDAFDDLLGRIEARGLPFWADPHKQQPGAINHEDGGRGVYFDDPSGHLLEAITVPYGGWKRTSGSGQS
jgi:catechol 2,3-dioxygenase-like lactoylglutathione lyase family enzyme